MVETSGGVQIQGSPQIIKQEEPRSLYTFEISEYIDNHQSYVTIAPPPKKPESGWIILYDKRVVDFFRQDGYKWKPEIHNPRKYKDIEIQGYYARGIPNDNFQRRLYWMKDDKNPNWYIVVVHYLEEQRGRSTTTKAKTKYEEGDVQDKKRIKKVTKYEAGSSSWSTNNNHQANYGIPSRVHITPLPPAAYEQDAIWAIVDRQKRDELGTEPDPGIPQSKDIGPSCSGTLNHQANTGSVITSVQDDQQFDQASFDYSGTTGVVDYQQNLYNEETGPRSRINHQANTDFILSADHEQLSHSHFGDNHEEQPCIDDTGADDFWSSLLEDTGADSLCPGADSLSSLLGDTGAPIDAPTEIIFPPMPVFPAGSTVVICSIEDFAPDWGYANTSTKVLIAGRFDQQHEGSCKWYCVFGEDEVPAEHLSVSNLRCYTPLKNAGKVEFYVKTSHGSRSHEYILFEFRDRQNQEIDNSGSYGNIEVSQAGFSQPQPTSITPLTTGTSHEQRMFEVDQVPDQALQAPPTKYGAKNKSRRWYKGVSNFLFKLGTWILKPGCRGLS